jgi:hypothetical protein
VEIEINFYPTDLQAVVPINNANSKALSALHILPSSLRKKIVLRFDGSPSFLFMSMRGYNTTVKFHFAPVCDSHLFLLLLV